MTAKHRRGARGLNRQTDYAGLREGIAELLDQSRRLAARSVNSLLTATYWEIGRRIVDCEQQGAERAPYGTALLQRLAEDLTRRFGRGFSERNLRQMRAFYLGWEIWQTAPAKWEACARRPPELDDAASPTRQRVSESALIRQTVSAESALLHSMAFRLSWSQYVRLLAVENPLARIFYEAEAIAGGWSVRQLDRQISTRFFERTAHSRRPQAVLARGRKPLAEDQISPAAELRDPYLLEFAGLKDEYSESELEDALIRHLEQFLLELGNGFAFVARQKRIRVGDEWYRIDLLLFHRRLKCLVVVDLKIGKFTHADAGQMNLYLNYVRENLVEPDEQDPIGLVLCSAKDDTVVHYAMGGINARVFAAKYLTVLPDQETLRREILATQQALAQRAGQQTAASRRIASTDEPTK